jgi:uncharacterized protein (TIGR02145 family)
MFLKFSFCLIFLALISSCKKMERSNTLDGLSAVTTSNIEYESLSSVRVSAIVLQKEGAENVIERGVCYSESSSPTRESFKKTAGEGFGNFDVYLTELKVNVTYYVRAYAFNGTKTSYGNELIVRITDPLVVTNGLVSITPNTAIVNGRLLSSQPIKERGVCWSINTQPTIATNKLIDEVGSETFSLQLSALKPATLYYVRAYAIVESGVIYGNQLSFTTKEKFPVAITTFDVSDITNTSAVSGGMILSDGGMQITQRGICWAKKSYPTIVDNSTNEGAGVGSFTSFMKGLEIGTTYYVRSYAINSEGVSYGNESYFRTTQPSSGDAPLIYDVNGNSYKTVYIGTQRWMSQNLKSSTFNDGTSIPMVTDNSKWESLKTAAWCYFNNDASSNNSKGKLYNWYILDPVTVGDKNICPVGWHIPSIEEIEALISYFGTDAQKLKSVTGWSLGSGNNQSGFNGLPVGYRATNGSYYGEGQMGVFWSNSEVYSYDARILELNTNNYPQTFREDKRNGYSVRCVKD